MFNYNGNSELIKECITLANDIVKDKKFLNKIRECEFFMSTCDGEVVATDVIASDERIRDIFSPGLFWEPLNVKLYKSKNPFTSAYGYFSPAKPDHIYLNTRKLNRSKGSIVSTLVHEMIHYCDNLNTRESYGHGDNSPVGKENTAPFYIDNIAESIIDNKEPDFNNVENGNITYYIPWYKKVLRWFR